MLAAAACTACSGAQHPAPTAAPTAAPRRFVSPYAYASFLEAELAFAHGDFAAAVEGYRRTLSDEDDPFVLARLADALERAGRPEEADQAIAEALDVDRASEAAWLAKGALAEGRGDADAALAAYARAVEAAPASVEATLALHRLLRDRGQATAARAVLERFGARHAGVALGAATTRVALELALAGDDADALARAADDWLRLGRIETKVLARTTRALLAHGRVAAALRLHEATPEAACDPAVAIEVLLAAGRFDAARARLARTPSEALGTPLDFAEISLRAHDPEEALRALALVDDGPHARVVQAEARLALGEAAQAAQLFASVPPDSTHRARALAGLAEALRAGGLDALATEVGRAQ